jgi:hypothetical protein
MLQRNLTCNQWATNWAKPDQTNGKTLVKKKFY